MADNNEPNPSPNPSPQPSPNPSPPITPQLSQLATVFDTGSDGDAKEAVDQLAPLNGEVKNGAVGGNQTGEVELEDVQSRRPTLQYQATIASYIDPLERLPHEAYYDPDKLNHRVRPDPIRESPYLLDGDTLMSNYSISMGSTVDSLFEEELSRQSSLEQLKVISDNGEETGPSTPVESRGGGLCSRLCPCVPQPWTNSAEGTCCAWMCINYCPGPLQFLYKYWKQDKFGTFDGVFTSCVLSMLGVISFLRVGAVVGQQGLILGLVTIFVSVIVVLVTTLSMSAICTNGTVKTGGAYYLISRSLGPRVGGSIGVIFATGNAIACGLNVLGFVETLVEQLGDPITGSIKNDYRLFGEIILVVLVCMALYGVGWVIKVQLLLLLTLVVAIGTFTVGTFVTDKPDQGIVGYSAQTISDNLLPNFTQGATFLTTFGVFFPAMTGIMAGANLSGDLKDPQKSIPRGTISAIFFVGMLYVVMFIMLAGSVTRIDCYSATPTIGLCYTLIMSEVSIPGALIYVGIYAATFSTALGTLVGSTRVLQAVAADNVIPLFKPFAKLRANGEPGWAYVLPILLAGGCIGIADLDTVASLVTVFYLLTYALINFACFQSSFSKSPGWRPEFRFYTPWLSLFGFFACAALMFVVNYIFAICGSGLVLAIYVYIYTLKPTVNWGSATAGRAVTSTLQDLINLRKTKDHVKNFRPHYLVLCGEPDSRMNLVRFIDTLREGHGAVFLSNIKTDMDALAAGRPEKRRAYYSKRLKGADPHRMTTFYNELYAPTFRDGAMSLIQTAGVGRIRPNTLVLGYKEDWREDTEGLGGYVDVVRLALAYRYGVMICRGFDSFNFELSDPFGTVDIYWIFDDGGLSILIPYILSKSNYWKNNTDSSDRVPVRLLLIHEEDQLKDNAIMVTQLLKKFRLDGIEVVSITPKKNPSDEAKERFAESIHASQFQDSRPDVTKRWIVVSELIHENSKAAKLVFVTVPEPRADEPNSYWMGILELVSGDMPPMVLIRGSRQHVLTWTSE